jgi:adenosylhomocysteinase
VDEITLDDRGKKVYLLGKGRIINLTAAEGHPPEVMQMSFANQFMAALYIRKNHERLEKKVYDVPLETEQEIARAMLASIGVRIDQPTAEQMKYAKSWAL